MISADSLILLTDTDGLFDQNPKDNTSGQINLMSMYSEISKQRGIRYCYNI